MLSLANKIETLICCSCGQKKKNGDYYKTYSDLYKGFSKKGDKFPICKTCMQKRYDYNYSIFGNIRHSIHLTCMQCNVPFSVRAFEVVVEDQQSNDDNKFSLYMRKLNKFSISTEDMNGYNFISILNGLEGTKDIFVVTDEAQLPVLKKEDAEVRDLIIEQIGYDPFENFVQSDLPYLYNELSSYLTPEIIEDKYMVNVYISICTDLNQIRKLDLRINQLSETQDALSANNSYIKILTSIKKDTFASFDTLCKENGISLKNRSNKTIGLTKLGQLMARYKDFGITDAETDYYGQKLSLGIQKLEKISLENIKQNIVFGDDEMNEIIEHQRKLLKEKDIEIMDLTKKLQEAKLELKE